MQGILSDSRSEAGADHPDRMNIQAKLEAAVLVGLQANSGNNESSADTASSGNDADSVIINAVESWTVSFAPNSDFYLRGNDALLILRELRRLGDVSVKVDVDNLPEWDQLDVNNNYLSWLLQVPGSVTEADIVEVFDWVDTECTVSIDANDINTDLSVPTDTPSGQDDADGISTKTSDAANARQGDAKPDSDVTAKVDVKPAAKPAAAAAPKASSNESSSIRIATDKIDQLINLVGELVITQSMLSRVSENPMGIDINELRERMADLEHNTRDLQESVMQVRMLPISSAFSRIPRLVRDLSRKLNKEVDLQMDGGSTELDKTVLERMIDPLVHLVRNGMDHGIETPEERTAAGKKGTGILHLLARQESGSVVIEIRDDGKGINGPFILGKAREKGIVGPDEELTDDQINQLIFAPGFSTAAVLSDVSGRGVGMDVVRRNILDLGGRVHVYSEFGKGTRIEINLPLSLAILDGQLVRVAGQVYVIPILSIIETLELAQTERSNVPGTGEICRFRGEYLQMLRVADHFRLPEPSTGQLVVVVDTHGKRMGLVIDEVLGQQQVVIKPLDKNYKSVKGLAGATIMSDGSVALILDPANIGEPEPSAEAA